MGGKSVQDLLKEYRAKRNFDAKKWVDEVCGQFNDYMRKSKLSGCVVSVSGGVDSAVTLALCIYASKMPNSPLKKVVAVAQPIQSSAWAYNRAKELCDKMGVPCVVVDQTKIHDELCTLVSKSTGLPRGKFADGMMRSYMRTPVGYYVAQLVSSAGNPCVVMGTGNQDEDGYLAYFCKAGDGCVDVQLISRIHKSEVFTVGWQLGVPASTLKAAPSADLWEGQTDEEELGFSYDFVELFTGAFLPLCDKGKKDFLDSLRADEKTKFLDAAKKCEKVHQQNKHKLAGIVNLPASL
jgi:NAD+ synthase (glutamine-hydrolysing)